MKKIIINIVLLIILFGIPYLPYKKAADYTCFDGNGVNLIVQYNINKEEPLVIKGSSYIKAYASVNNLNDINYSEVNAIGNTPYKELSTFNLGKPKYVDFLVKGSFVDDINNIDTLTLNVYDWYPIGKHIRIMDTVLWHSYNLSLIFNYLVVIIIIVIIYNIRKVFFKSL